MIYPLLKKSEVSYPYHYNVKQLVFNGLNYTSIFPNFFYISTSAFTKPQITEQCRANQLTGFYMIGTLAVKRLTTL